MTFVNLENPHEKFGLQDRLPTGGNMWLAALKPEGR